jgi:hypothetical protein
VLDGTNELAARAFAVDPDLAVGDVDLQLAGRERADEDDLARRLADVDEAAGAGEPRAELADVEVAFGVGLREAEDRDVEAAAVVEVELARLVDHRLRVDRGAEVEPARGDAADDARLGGERQQVEHLLLGGDVGDALGHADAEVDDRVALELERGPARDHLARAERERRERAHRHPQLAGERGAVLRRERLHVVLGALGDDDAVDEDARHLDLARVQRAALGDALDLRDHDAAAVVRRHRDRERLERQRLVLHRQVAVGVGGRRADDPDLDRKRLVEEHLLAVDLHQADEVVLRRRVDLAAALARIDERAEADLGERSRLARGDVANRVRDDALRQVVRLDLAGDRELLELRDEPPVAADDALDEAAVAEVVEAARLAVALPGRRRRASARAASRLPASASLLRNRCSSASATPSAKPMPTKPLVGDRCRRRGSGERPRRR